MSSNIDGLNSPRVNPQPLLDSITFNQVLYLEYRTVVKELFDFIIRFYDKKNTEEQDSEELYIPYQYRLENQAEFLENFNKLSALLAGMYDTLINVFHNLYPMENPMIQTASEQIPMSMSSGAETHGLFGLFKRNSVQQITGIKNKEEQRMDSPYKVSMVLIEEIKEQRVLLDAIVEFHSYGKDWCEFTTKIGMSNYLNIEITEVQKRLPKIIRVIEASMKLGIQKEQNLVKDVFAGIMNLNEKHSNDFQFQPPPTALKGTGQS